MGAIEIMDPRMDTGMQVSEQKEFDISARLTPEQVMYVMDRLVTLEMAWIAGHSLPQTVYTCVYFHHLRDLNEMQMPTIESDVEDIVFGALKSYILATAKCCHYVYTEMSNRNVFEQEDFTSNLYGLNLDDQHPHQLICNELNAVIYLLRDLMNIGAYDVNILQQIIYRTEMRTSYLFALIYLAQEHGSYLTQAKTELHIISEHLKKIDLTLSQDYSEAFDLHINRKLTAHGTPRAIKLSTESESFKNYEMLIERLSSICEIVEYPSATSLMNYLAYFGSKQPFADAFSRSTLNTLFYHNRRIFGTILVPQLIQTLIKETVHPPAWCLSSQPQFKDALGHFYEQVSLAFIEYCKINFQNRSRQRRLLCKLLPHWDQVQKVAENLDKAIHELYPDTTTPFYYSSWVYYYKLLAMEKILFLGFELELYSEQEYIMIYWYISNVLGVQNMLIERIKSFAEGSSTILHTEQLLVHAKKGLSDAMLRILITAKHTKQFDQQHIVFDDEESRYIHRFKQFAKLDSPVHPTYEIFSKMIRVDQLDAAYMMQLVRHDLTRSKQILESVVIMTSQETNTQMCHGEFIKEITNLLHTTVFNMNQIQHIPGPSLVLIDFKYSHLFPIIYY